jgi:hypothetical protein
MYIGFGNNNGTAHWYLTATQCKARSMFLGIWARSRLPTNRSEEIDVTAVFCKPGYSYVDASITVDGTTGAISDYKFIGKPTNFTEEDKIISTDVFENNLGAGSTPWNINPKHFAVVSPTSTVRFEEWNLYFPTGQIGFAIGLENKTFDAFQNPEVFGDALNKMHKLLFNNAMATMLLENKDPKGVQGIRVVRSDGIVVVSTVAHLVAGFLAAVAACLIAVFLLSYKRHNSLSSDPDSLATKMSLVAESKMLLRDFEGSDNCPKPERCIQKRWYEIGSRDGEGGPRLDIVNGSHVINSQGAVHLPSPKHDGRGVRPWELSFGMGAFAALFTSGLFVLLIVLFESDRRYDGKSPPISSITNNHSYLLMVESRSASIIRQPAGRSANLLVLPHSGCHTHRARVGSDNSVSGTIPAMD